MTKKYKRKRKTSTFINHSLKTKLMKSKSSLFRIMSYLPVQSTKGTNGNKSEKNSRLFWTFVKTLSIRLNLIIMTCFECIGIFNRIESGWIRPGCMFAPRGLIPTVCLCCVYVLCKIRIFKDLALYQFKHSTTLFD